MPITTRTTMISPPPITIRPPSLRSRLQSALTGRPGGSAAEASGKVGRMSEDTHRQVRIERIENSRYTVTNERGGQVTIGSGGDTDFTPVELLLAAIGCCSSIDVDILTSRRAEPDAFVVD